MTKSKKDKATYPEQLDYALNAALGKYTLGVSPSAVLLAFYDWYLHLLLQPSKQLELFDLYQQNYWHLFTQFLGQLSNEPQGEYVAIGEKPDTRFTKKAWQRFPYSFIYESFLIAQNWWHVAATDVHGVSRHHEEVVDFGIRQILDMLSPSNSPLTNPEIQEAALNEAGENFFRGLENYIEDTKRIQKDEPPVGAEEFIVGKNVAITPGNVIYRNQLIELIQYAPANDHVYAEPILITPAWIMKYYILDLSPKHSLVNYLVEKGHTVFMISWKNPTRKERELGMEDYLNLGIFSALDVITGLIPKQKIHLVGYCLGGTLASIAAAALARNDDDRLATLTLLAAQTDFTEPGELGLFIDASQITFLENMMREKGYLDTHQMAGAFQLLRSNDLIWSRMIHDYMLGKRKPMKDLMAWNADATRLPYKMHSDYLRELFLHNSLAEGKYHVNGEPIALTDIRIPIFVVATERDHVSPWHSVFKINLLTDVDVTFTLTSGGHNVGIVSIPTQKTERYYHSSTLKEKDRYINADAWLRQAKKYEGSWWPAWETWIDDHSSEKITAPPIGSAKKGYPALEDAPGTYVLAK